MTTTQLFILSVISLSFAAGFVPASTWGKTTSRHHSTVPCVTETKVANTGRVKAGDALPAGVMLVEGTADGSKQVYNIREFCSGKKVVLFAVPGAFTPGCSKSHMPSFAAAADEMFKKGVDAIICTATNDPYVMEGWGRDQGVVGKILLLSDAETSLASSFGVLQDGGGGMPRSERYSMIIEDNIIKHVFFAMENGVKDADKTYAPNVMKYL